MKPLLFFIVMLSASSGALLFRINYEVLRIEKNLKDIFVKMDRTKENIYVLEAEWAYLNNHKRIAELSKRYLKVEPLKQEQILGLGAEALSYKGAFKQERQERN